MSEIWKPVLGYEDLYEVSNEGRVKSLARFTTGKKIRPILPRILHQHVRVKYLRTNLTKNHIMKSYSVHRLVAEAFIPNPENKPFVNHKDGNTRNNFADNLEWCTRLENALHCRKVLGRGNIRNSKELVEKIRELLAAGVIGKDVARICNTTRPFVSTIKNNRSWQWV